MKHQEACDDEEAQPLLERRGNLPGRLFYVVAGAGRDHDQKNDGGLSSAALAASFSDVVLGHQSRPH
jgi:hypothetical protein